MNHLIAAARDVDASRSPFDDIGPPIALVVAAVRSVQEEGRRYRIVVGHESTPPCEAGSEKTSPRSPKFVGSPRGPDRNCCPSGETEMKSGRSAQARPGEGSPRH